jgi:hypothetical protein
MILPDTARKVFHKTGLVLLVSIVACQSCKQLVNSEADGPRWLAGDHHIHSRYSVGWNRGTEPPTPILAGDAIYPIQMNALMARHYGLSWMVTTDHGGPNHSKVNLEKAYPELLRSRKVVPDLVQFYGMEFDTPAADHSSLIIPHTADEAQRLYTIESQFDKVEPFPRDPTWDTEDHMMAALKVMDTFPSKPIIIANHPSRSATGLGFYGLHTPEEFRNWNDLAPEVSVGMAGAPGHQANTLNADGTLRESARGGYERFPTMGGFDQMTAQLGGFWDSMLGEGRRWWITANSDSHINWTEGASDFWPGEYSKTYVWAVKNHDDILDGVRNGRIFVTLGDLIAELYVSTGVDGSKQRAEIGGTLEVPSGADVLISIRFLDPEFPNSHGDNPKVARVDLITGGVTGWAERNADTNKSTRVAARFPANEWSRDGDYYSVEYRLEKVTSNSYLRVRGTNGNELEPEEDPTGEDPWSDLWFYSNPVFLKVE